MYMRCMYQLPLRDTPHCRRIPRIYRLPYPAGRCRTVPQRGTTARRWYGASTARRRSRHRCAATSAVMDPAIRLISRGIYAIDALGRPQHATPARCTSWASIQAGVSSSLPSSLRTIPVNTVLHDRISRWKRRSGASSDELQIENPRNHMAVHENANVSERRCDFVPNG